jgi:thermitase
LTLFFQPVYTVSQTMNKLATLLVIVGAVFLFGFGGAVKAQGALPPDSGRILVKFKDKVFPGEKIKWLEKNFGRLAGKIEALDVLVLQVPPTARERITAALAGNPYIEFAEADSWAQAFLVPDDPYFSFQWGWENLGQTINGAAGVVDADLDGPEAWDRTLGGVKVAVLDTGVDQDHEDLAGKIAAQKKFTDSPTIDDLYGHGTHVAGIIAATANNQLGIAGGCPACQLMNGKVLNDSGAGAYSWIANGIIWAADNGAKVINLSLGGSSRSVTLEQAVNYAWNKGVVVVAAAGNNGSSAKMYPAAYVNAIAVAATNNRDQKASFSNYGAKWVDVAAPGQDIFSTFPNHPYKINRSLNYDFASGTSMAAPMTSAVAALIWSTPIGTTAASVRTRLESTADKIAGTGLYWSAGRVNAASAVAY